MKIIVAILLLLTSANAIAQVDADSFESRQVLLKEILIRTDGSVPNNKAFRPDKNIQTGTDQILNSLQGVSIIKRGNYAWEPGIRGLNGGRINVTIDGMAIFGACTDKMDPVSSYIEPSNLKSMVVSYGTNEVTSGNNIGGGFDFRINQPSFKSSKSFSGMIGSLYETNGNAFQTLARLAYSEKRLGITVNGIFKNSQNYKAGKNETIKYSQYSKWNGGIGMKYKVNSHNNITLNYIHDDGNDIGYPALGMDVLYARADIVSLTHQLHFGKGILKKIENKIYYNHIAHAMDDTKRAADEVTIHMDMPGNSETAGFISTGSMETGKHRLKLKLSGYQNRLHAEMTMYPKDAAPMFMLTMPDAQRRYAEFNLNDQYSVSEKWMLMTGISVGISNSSIYSEEGKQTLEGSLQSGLKRVDGLYSFYISPVYQVNEKVSLDFNSGYSMRAATLQELFGFYLFNRMDAYDYIGNPELNNESSWNFSGGIRAKAAHLNFEGRAFIYLMNNYIAGIRNDDFDVMTSGALGVKQYQNMKSAQLSGFEANVSCKLLPGIIFASSNGFSYGSDSKGNALPNIPAFRSIEKLSIRWNQFQIEPEVVFSAAQHHVSKEMYGESATPHSTVYNLSIGRSFKSKAGTLSLMAAVQNIFDLYYYEHNSIGQIPRIGRSISIQCNWQF